MEQLLRDQRMLPQQLLQPQLLLPVLIPELAPTPELAPILVLVPTPELVPILEPLRLMVTLPEGVVYLFNIRFFLIQPGNWLLRNRRPSLPRHFPR